MRIKHMIVTGVALATLFGCGNNTTESIDNRQLDHIENVRNQPSQRQRGNEGMNQMPGGPRAPIGENQNNRNNRTGQNTAGDGLFDNGRVDQGDDGRIDDNDRSEGRNTGNNGNPLTDNGYQTDRQRFQSQENRARNGQSLGQMNDNQGQAGQNQARQGQNQQDNYRVSQDIADRVTSEVNEVDSAYVLTLGNNAYVACQLDNDQTGSRNNDLSEQLEREVTEAVRDADDNIENVFVSSNPDFLDLTSNYARDIDRGQPVEGFFDQFTEMIERIFPTRNR